MTLCDYTTLDSPAGLLHVATRGDAAVAIGFDTQWPDLAIRLGLVLRAPPERPASVLAALAAYFRGDLRALDTVDVDLAGTPLQLAVWRALRSIPGGQPSTYSDLARRVGFPSAVRAVSSAVAKNPVSIVIPCHRVIGKDGALHGYAGGLDKKRWLLAHEAGMSRAARVSLSA